MTARQAPSGDAPPLDARFALIAIAVIAIAAIATRFWRLGWGLSDGMAFADELFYWPSYFRAFVPLRPESFLRRDTPAALLYPTLYGNASGIAVWLTRKLGWIADPNETFRALYVARFVSASAGVVNVGLVGALGWRFYGPRVGLAAAALMAVVPLEAMQAHYASVDLMLGLATTLSLLAACELARTGSRGIAVAAGVAAGLAFSSKYTGLVLAVACGWAILERIVLERSIRIALILVPFALLGFALGFGVGCPACVLQSPILLRTLDFLSHASSLRYLAFWNYDLVPALGWYGRPYVYQLVAGLTFNLGWPLYLTVLAGIFTALRCREVTDRLLLVTLGAYFLSIGMSFLLEVPRYFIPMVPALMVLAARWMMGLRAPTVRRGVFAAVWAYTLALTLSQVSRYSWQQQKDVAAWIRTEFNGAPMRVAYPSSTNGYYGLRQPIIWNGMTPWPIPIDRWLVERPQVLVVPEWFSIRVRRGEPTSAANRVLDQIESGRAGYREARRWESTYLQSGFYTWIDPALAADLSQGEIGFRVYVREPGGAPSTAPTTGS